MTTIIIIKSNEIINNCESIEYTEIKQDFDAVYFIKSKYVKNKSTFNNNFKLKLLLINFYCCIIILFTYIYIWFLYYFL